MSNQALVMWYLRECLGDGLTSSGCGPVWQIAVIGVLVVAALLALVVLRLRARSGEA